MKQPAAFFKGLRLSQKLTIAVFCMVLVPVEVFSLVLFSTTQRLVEADKMKEIEQGLLQVQLSIEKTVDLCNMTAQVFQNNAGLRGMLLAAKRGETFTTEALLTFYRGDVAGLERLVSANPYLYQVRVFLESDSLPEMMPILYHANRMGRLSWAREGWTPGSWQYDYADAVYPPEVTNPTPHLMALVTTIEDFDEGTLGVLEVSVRMDEIIPGLFDSAPGRQSAFVTAQQKLVCAKGAAAFWQTHREEVLSRPGELPHELGTASMVLDGKTAWVTVMPLGRIGGAYVVVTLPGEVASHLGRFRSWYLLGMVGLLLLLAFAIHIIVRRMLRRLYLIFDAVVAVGKGDLYVTVPNLGEDEVGRLGSQLNLMLERIVGLMEENVSRQVLAKNFEIRALQSQINAHFIYNVLESVKMMAVVDEKYEIADAIQSLGELLRYSMHWSVRTASLAEELEHVGNYLCLINLRFDYRVELHSAVAPELLTRTLPKLTLQPIVENAVVHGIEELARDTRIDLEAGTEDDALTLTVTDYGKGINEDRVTQIQSRLAGARDQDVGKSIGLKNVQDRIVAEYGPGYGIAVESRPGEYTRVTIRLPDLDREEEGRENAVDRRG